MFDFGVGYSELFVLAIMAILVIGPKELPKVMRTIGGFMKKARGMAREFQGHVDAAMKETGVDDIKKSMGGAVNFPDPNKTGSTAPSIAAPITPPENVTSLFESSSKGETRVAGALVET